MQKRKQKLTPRRALLSVRHTPRFLILPVFIVTVSMVALLATSVQSVTPGRACVNAPTSPYPSLDVVVQKGSVRTDKTVTNQHVISCLSDDLHHLPEMPASGVTCPASDGSTYILSFDGGRIITGSLTGCQAVKIQDDSKIYYLQPSTPYTRDMRSKLLRITQ